MKILITGNMGYIGPAVVDRLRSSHPEAILVGLDTGYFAGCLTRTKILPERQLNVQHFCDVRNISDKILEGVDAVVHLAAISNDPMGEKFEDATYAINYHASVNLAEKARSNGVKFFVFASSCSIYGQAEDQPRTEKSTLNPLTAYAKSKILTEKALEKLANKQFVVTCLRFATACGMSDRLRLDLVLNDFVASTLLENEITILSDGTPWRPLIDTKDMARAIDWAITRQYTNGNEFLCVNAGSDEWNYQVRELAEAVAEVVPKVKININKDAPFDKRSYRANFDLFKELAPDHQPQMGLKDTVRELKDGLLKMNFRDPNFRSSPLTRLNMLAGLRQQGLLNEQLEWQHLSKPRKSSPISELNKKL